MHVGEAFVDGVVTIARGSIATFYRCGCVAAPELKFASAKAAVHNIDCSFVDFAAYIREIVAESRLRHFQNFLKFASPFLPHYKV